MRGSGSLLRATIVGAALSLVEATVTARGVRSLSEQLEAPTRAWNAVWETDVRVDGPQFLAGRAALGAAFGAAYVLYDRVVPVSPRPVGGALYGIVGWAAAESVTRFSPNPPRGWGFPPRYYLPRFAFYGLAVSWIAGHNDRS